LPDFKNNKKILNMRNKLKMNKILCLFLSLIILSCGENDDTADVELTDPLIGVWLSEGTIDDVEGSFTYKYTFNLDNTGSNNSTFSFDGETETENELFTWENKGLDFKATSQTYNILYEGDEYGGNDEIYIFSDDFKTFTLDTEDGLIPFTKQ
jgi:hypothetical protein